jgi:hypothetical protein
MVKNNSLKFVYAVVGVLVLISLLWIVNANGVVNNPVDYGNYSSVGGAVVFNVTFINGTDVGIDSDLTNESIHAVFYKNGVDVIGNSSACIDALGVGTNFSCYGSLTPTVALDGVGNISALIVNATGYSKWSVGNLTNVRFDSSSPTGIGYSTQVVASGNYSGSVVFNVTITDAGIGVSYLFFNVSNATEVAVVGVAENATRYSGSLNTVGLADGLYNVTVYANDTLNNLNSTVKVLNIVVDNTVPVVAANAINSPVSYNNYTNLTAGMFVLNVTLTDALSGINYVFFNVTSGTVSTVFAGTAENTTRYSKVVDSKALLADGLYNVTVYANDSAGKLNATSAVVSVRVDNTGPAIILATPVSGGNYSTSVIFNASVGDAGINNVSYVFFNITNATAAWSKVVVAVVQNTTLYWNSTYNPSALADGLYNVTVYANDTLNNVNSSVVALNIRIDRASPTSISLSSPGARGNYSEYSGLIIFNVSLVDSVAGVNYVFFNVTNGSVQNTTVVGTRENATRYSGSLNTTVLPDGVYNVTVYANDSSGNLNSTATVLNIVVDNTRPTGLSMSCTPEGVDEDDTVTCVCSGTDATSGVLSTNYTASPSTSSTGTFTETCTVTDYAQNVQTTTDTYTVETGTSSGGSSGGGGSVVSKWVKEIKLNDSSLNLGQTLKGLKSNYRITFNVKGLGHSIGILNLSSTTATIEVASTPQTATLSVGETKKFDLDNDKYYDIAVTLSSIVNGEADITTSVINEKVEVSAQTGNVTTGTGNDSTVGANAGTESDNNNSMTIFIIVGVIVVVIILFFVFRAKRK